MLALARFQLGGRQPVQAYDLLVQRSAGLLGRDVAGEAEAQESHVLRRVVPAVDADERARLEAVRGLLEHLAPAGVDQRLAGIEMTGGLVEHPAAVDALLDEKEFSAALDDRGDGHRRWLPGAHAALRVFFRMKSAMRATPASIADLDAAYEKRTCWPSPGTRLPKWMSASRATPASFSRRFLNSSESAAPTPRQASVTFGHT